MINSEKKLWHKSYTHGVPYEVIYENITMTGALSRTADKFPESDALIFADTKINYKKFNNMVNSMAKALAELGVIRGTKVALLLPNIPQILIAMHAAWRAGGTVVLNNPLYTDSELEHQLNDSGATVLICLDLLAPRMIALKDKTPVKKIVEPTNCINFFLLMKEE